MEEQKFDKNKYDQQYKRDHFDHINIFLPKGTKDKIKNRAKEQGLTLSEYIRGLISKDLNEDT